MPFVVILIGIHLPRLTLRSFMELAVVFAVSELNVKEAVVAASIPC
jgi:hypothetical protein